MISITNALMGGFLRREKKEKKSHIFGSSTSTSSNI